jgi:hypothetical protein
MNVGLVSIKAIIERVYRRLGVNEDLPEDDMIEWVGEALLRIGAYSQFKPKVTTLQVNCSKVEVPCDFYKLIEITYSTYTNCVKVPLPWKNESFTSDYFCDDCEIAVWRSYNDEYFMINDSYIYTSFDKGELCVAYLAIPTDADGYPMVPDEELVIDACAKYVIYQLDYREFRKGAITDKVFQHSEREWHWGVGAARGALNMPNTQQLESLRNVLQRLIPNQVFRNDRERRKLH